MLRNFAIFNMEDFGVVVGFEDVGEMLTVGIGDKDLTEIIALYHFHDPFNSLAVQPVKYVI